MTMTTEKPSIADLNDTFRRGGAGCPVPGQTFITPGVDALGWPFMSKLMAAVREFTEFTEDNDPHGEHDFGAVTVEGHKVFWKIDCYDTDYKYGSEDPADITKTRRVLTLMLPEEY